MRYSSRGFTIVELLIVIVVIGILATIAVTTYTRVQISARNASRISQARQLMTVLEAYKVNNGEYPVVAPGPYCVGVGYPNGLCREYLLPEEHEWAHPESERAFTDELATVGAIPITKVYPAGSVVGPYVEVDEWGFNLLFPMETEKESDCPKGSEESWNNPENNEYLCFKRYNYGT